MKNNKKTSFSGNNPSAQHYIVPIKGGSLSGSDRGKRFAEADTQTPVFFRHYHTAVGLLSITDLDDLRIKAAIIMHYFNKVSWRDIAQKIGMGDSEESIRKAVRRFLDTQEEKSNEKDL